MDNYFIDVNLIEENTGAMKNKAGLFYTTAKNWQFNYKDLADIYKSPSIVMIVKPNSRYDDWLLVGR
jgi:hypothetical protein